MDNLEALLELNIGPFVNIPEEEYLLLLEDSRILHKLYAGGVDNWEWYGEALNTEDDTES